MEPPPPASRAIRSALDLVSFAIVVADPGANATWVNRAWRELTAQTTRRWQGRGWFDAGDDADRAARQDALLAAARSGAPHRADWVVSDGDHRRRTLHVHAVPELDRGELVRIVVTASDVTDDRARATQATHDSLTGLFNRARFLEFLEHALDRQRRAPERVAAVLFIDVDNLKVTNDTSGHDAGDQVLRDVAERIKTAVRPADVVARYGGDEFTVLCEDLRDAGEADAIAERIREATTTAPRHDVSIGVAIADEPGTEPNAVVAAADRAMYRTKRGLTTHRPRSVRRRTPGAAARRPLVLRADDGARASDIDVLSVAAHELRTPLATIAGVVTTLRDARDAMTPEGVDAGFAILERQIGRLAATLDELLDLGRYHHEARAPRPVAVADVVADALEIAPPPGHVTLTTTGDVAALLMVAAVRSTVTRALVNLLTNAYRHGGPNVAIDARDGTGVVALSVQDDGPGVPSTLGPAMFAPFVRFGKRDASQPAGVGLGLALAREIAESMGGRLTHEPVQPHGARFTLELPASTSLSPAVLPVVDAPPDAGGVARYSSG